MFLHGDGKSWNKRKTADNLSVCNCNYERTTRDSPAPFIGAGFFFAHSSFLADVPFDPYVPWVFMGEEILESLRMWTWGYDIYSPTRNVLSHFYVRRHTPKFWETVNR